MAPNIDLTQVLNSQAFISPVNLDKKQGKDLLLLSTIIQELQEEVAAAKGAMNPKVTVANEFQGNSSDFGTAMAQMAYALQILEISITKADRNKAKFDYEIAKTQVKMAQDQCDKVQKKLEEIAKEKEKESTINFWTKFAEVAAALIISTIAACCGQFEIVALTITMATLSVSGAFDEAAKGISSLLQDCGMSKLDADIVSKVIVLVAVIALTIVIAPESAAGEAADTATDVSDEVATDSIEMSDLGSATEETASTTSSTATDAASGVSKLQKAWKTIKSALTNVRANLVVSNALQTLSQLDINEVIDQLPLSSDEKKKIEMGLEIALLILTIISSITSVAAMSGGVENGSSIASRVASRSKSLAKLGRFVSSMLPKAGATTLKAGEIGRELFMWTASALQVAEGAVLIKQGKLTKELAEATANMEIYQVLMDLMNREAANTMKLDTAIQHQHQEQDKHFLQTFAAGEQAFAQLLTTYSPV